MEAEPAKVLRPEDGVSGFLGSIGVRFMISHADSGGGFFLVEHPMSARALEPRNRERISFPASR